MTTGRPPISRSAADRGPATAFTLVEVLVAMAIVAVLIALLLPAARGAVGSARAFKCQMSQRSVAFDFTVFADDSLHPNRGDDDEADENLRLGPKGTFRLETFIDSQYGADEFWNAQWGNRSTVEFPDAQGRDPMRCAEVRGSVTLRRNLPCTQGAVTPPAAVSFGFNSRLHLSEAAWARGDSNPVRLSGRILQGNDVASPGAIPLLWDVDGQAAAARDKSPLLSAPALAGSNLYAGDEYWFPAARHAGALNVAFADGHVASSKRPLAESRWAWGFDSAR